MAAVVVVQTKGEEKLLRLAEAIKASGDKAVRRECAAGFRRAVRPMKREFQRGALGILPHRGGLGEWVAAGTRITSQISLGGNPSVRVTGSLPGHDLDAMDRGRIRHPTYGHRDRWVRQSIRPGWWTDSGTLAAQDARQELEKAMDILAAKLEADA